MPHSTFRHTAPTLLLLAIYATFVALVLVAWSRDLDRSLASNNDTLSQTPPTLREALAAYADPAFDISKPAASLPRRLASLLLPGNGLYPSLKCNAFTFLLQMQYEPDDIARQYLSRIPVHIGNSRPIHGIPQAVQIYFGQIMPPVMADSLNLGEALLLCHLTFNTNMIEITENPGAALELRDRLLDQMITAGLLTPSAYETEINRPFSPREDHIPIW
ncbi:MAG: transglycosylase domain-containing protein [bacterium]|nr:transglycosylase domain-containing protein [bacterium]